MQGFTYKYGDRPLEGYTIQRAAGRGGFGEVYYALSDSGREVALKVVQGYEAIELRGISQCMNLKSPHLVTIFDVKYNEQGKPFVLMEFVAGPSLRQLLDESPAGLGTQKTAFFLREMAKGLTYLHDRGIVHRDLKPGNVFYEDGYVKIGDYGLSKAISASKHSGQTITVGTVHYMAPEIGQGNYDCGIDIYALGCMTYEMLTGQTPYLGSSPGEILMKHMMEQPDLTNIEEPFATAIRKALAKDPKDRFATVQEMVEAIFGSEHIQQSVSCFSPESLTMVAGRVARKVTAGGPGSSGQVGFDRPMVGGADRSDKPAPEDSAAPGNWENRFERKMQRVDQKMERVGERLEVVGQRLGEKLERMAERIQDKVHGRRGRESVPPTALTPTASQPLAVDPSRDPLSYQHRRLLSIVAWLLLAFASASLSTNSSTNEDVIISYGMMSLLLSAGGILGLWIVYRRMMPALASEARVVQQLAAGGVASVLALLISIPAIGVWLDGEGGFGRELRTQGISIAGTIAASLAPLFLLGWMGIMRPDRKARISLGHAILAAMLGGGLAAAFSGNIALVAGTAAGMSLAMQVACPFDPLARRHGRSTSGGHLRSTPANDSGVAPEPQGSVEAIGTRAEERAQRREDRRQARHEWRQYRRQQWGWPPPAGVWTTDGYRVLPQGVSPRKRLIALLLMAPCFGGVCGIQRFYVGKIGTGLLYFFTAGLLGIGQLIDLILILSGAFKDRRGRRLVTWIDHDEILSPEASAPVGWQGAGAEGPAAAAADPRPAGDSGGPAGKANAEQPSAAAAPQQTQVNESPWAHCSPMSMCGWNSRTASGRPMASAMLSFMSGMLVFITLLAGVMAGLAVPGIVVAGAANPILSQKSIFGVLTDPVSFDMICSVAQVLAAALLLGAAILLLLGRRWGGGVYMLRGLLGTVGLLMALYMYWACVVPDVNRLQLAVVEMRRHDVQQTVNLLYKGLHSEPLLMAGGCLLASILMLAWPVRPKNQPTPLVGKGV